MLLQIPQLSCFSFVSAFVIATSTSPSGNPILQLSPIVVVGAAAGIVLLANVIALLAMRTQVSLPLTLDQQQHEKLAKESKILQGAASLLLFSAFGSLIVPIINYLRSRSLAEFRQAGLECILFLIPPLVYRVGVVRIRAGSLIAATSVAKVARFNVLITAVYGFWLWKATPTWGYPLWIGLPAFVHLGVAGFASNLEKILRGK